MIENNYKLIPTNRNKTFFFQSKGPKGTILKVILFQERSKRNKFNSAFGDVKNNIISDKIVSDNKDMIKVISTVALAIHKFVESYPESIISIIPVDKRRKKLYNAIFQRRIEEINLNFYAWGIIGGKTEIYSKEKFYDEFEIKHKIL